MKIIVQKFNIQDLIYQNHLIQKTITKRINQSLFHLKMVFLKIYYQEKI
jgi:hypothetical protein